LARTGDGHAGVWGALVAIFAVMSCASAGQKIDRTHLGDISEGAQNKAQIRSWFGEPYTQIAPLSGHVKGCTERWIYEYAKARGFGVVTYQESLVVDFDAKGAVCDHAFAHSGSE
jgi:hypothetical protein